jgi:hypothetical protein
MNGWIKTNHDFGIPWAVFTISQRDLALNSKFLEAHKALKADKPEEIAESLERLIEFHRPNLKGVKVIGLLMPAFGRFDIQCIHPALPKVKDIGLPKSVRLDTCPVCGGDFGDQLWRRESFDDNLGGIEVCSEACVTASKRYGREFI